MANYTPEKFMIPTYIDELGIRLGLSRNLNESLEDYYRRVNLEMKSPSGGSFVLYEKSISRKLGLFDKLTGTVELVINEDGTPAAEDPVFRVTASGIKAWSNYQEDEIDIDILFKDYPYLVDVAEVINSSSYFSFSQAFVYEEYTESSTLGIVTSESVNTRLLPGNNYYETNISYIKDIYFSRLDIFREEKETISSVDEEGEYAIDYNSGVIFSFIPMAGIAKIKYSMFPLELWSRAARAYNFHDEGMPYILKDIVRDEDGAYSPMRLNSTGTRLYNAVLSKFPLEWGD